MAGYFSSKQTWHAAVSVIAFEQRLRQHERGGKYERHTGSHQAEACRRKRLKRSAVPPGSFPADGCSTVPRWDPRLQATSISVFFLLQTEQRRDLPCSSLYPPVPRVPNPSPHFHPAPFPSSRLSHPSLLLSSLVTHSCTSRSSIPEELPSIS